MRRVVHNKATLTKIIKDCTIETHEIPHFKKLKMPISEIDLTTLRFGGSTTVCRLTTNDFGQIKDPFIEESCAALFYFDGTKDYKRAQTINAKRNKVSTFIHEVIRRKDYLPPQDHTE